MPIRPNPLENLLFFTFNQGPAPLLDLWSAVAFRAVTAAIRLGVFDALADAPLTRNELAQKAGLHSRGCAVLTAALESLGYLIPIPQGERLALSPMAQKWLTTHSQANFAPYFTFWDTVLRELYHNLEESLQTGETPTNLYEWLEGQAETSLQFQQAMIAIARLVSREITGRLRFLSGGGRLLDVGGGHGEYSVALCRKFPHLEAVLFDSPQALAAGRKHVAVEKLGQRITFQEGNFLTSELPTGFDAVLLFNIVHGFTAEQNMAVFRKVRRALQPGGRVVVLDQLDKSIPMATLDATARLLALSYYHMLGGRVYTFDEIAGWLEAAGFREVQRIDLIRVPGNALILGHNGESHEYQ